MILNTYHISSPHGQTINVAAADVLLPSPPPLGTIVSVSFDNTARRDAPVNSKVYRIRSDLEWEEVMRSAMRDKRLPQFNGTYHF